jgi:hypothetical protein
VASFLYARQPAGAKRAPAGHTCTAACALWGQDVPHRHLTFEARVSERRGVLDDTFLGALEFYAVDEKRVRTYNFAPNEWDVGLETFATLQGYRKAGRICAAYLPVPVFGPSPRSGLSYEQRQILIALTRETTRFRQSERKDRAAVVVGGATGSQVKVGVAACP